MLLKLISAIRRSSEPSGSVGNTAEISSDVDRSCSRVKLINSHRVSTRIISSIVVRPRPSRPSCGRLCAGGGGCTVRPKRRGGALWHRRLRPQADDSAFLTAGRPHGCGGDGGRLRCECHRAALHFARGLRVLGSGWDCVLPGGRLVPLPKGHLMRGRISPLELRGGIVPNAVRGTGRARGL